MEKIPMLSQSNCTLEVSKPAELRETKEVKTKQEPLKKNFGEDNDSNIDTQITYDTEDKLQKDLINHLLGNDVGLFKNCIAVTDNIDINFDPEILKEEVLSDEEEKESICSHASENIKQDYQINTKQTQEQDIELAEKYGCSYRGIPLKNLIVNLERVQIQATTGDTVLPILKHNSSTTKDGQSVCYKVFKEVLSNEEEKESISSLASEKCQQDYQIKTKQTQEQDIELAQKYGWSYHGMPLKILRVNLKRIQIQSIGGDTELAILKNSSNTTEDDQFECYTVCTSSNSNRSFKDRKLKGNETLENAENMKETLRDTKSSKENHSVADLNNFFFCDHCNLKFVAKDLLIYHLKKHSIVNFNFKCKLCQYKCHTKTMLKQHRLSHDLGAKKNPRNRKSSEKKRIRLKKECQVCGKYVTKYKVHLMTHTGEKPYQCSICKRSFPLNCVLNRHMRLHSTDKPFECAVCAKKFKEKSVLITHLKTHTVERPYHCTLCTMRCVRKSDLKMHMLTHTGKRNYQCLICDKKFMRSEHLAVHLRMHTGEQPYACSVCNRKFSVSSSLKNHLRLHTGELLHQCSVCDKRFNTKGQLAIHMRTHTGEKPYKCSVCDKRFAYSASLRKHSYVHSVERPFVYCTVCNKQLVDKSRLKAHMLTHTGKKDFHCSVCDKQFKHKQYLKIHMRVHSGEQPYQCSVCDKKFSVSSSLNTHMRLHTGERPHQCSICEKQFNQSGGLSSHMLTHTGEQHYECSVCNRKFSQPNSLKFHLRTHTGEEPYHCSVCDRKFKAKSTLTTHMKVHTGEKSHRCTECGNKFRRKAHLTMHYRTHTGEKPYKCSVCEKAFSTQSSLKTHERRHTGERPYHCTVCGKSFVDNSDLKKHSVLHNRE